MEYRIVQSDEKGYQVGKSLISTQDVRNLELL